MKFEKKINNGRPVIFLNLEGLTIPQQEISETYLEFSADAYTSLGKQKSTEGWEAVFKIPNEFLARVEPEALIQIAVTFVACHYNIKAKAAEMLPPVPNNPIRDKANTNYNANILLKLEDHLSAIICELDKSIHLLDRLEAFVAPIVPTDDFINAGNRPQDTPEKTFHIGDVIKVHTLSALSKLMCPIFSAFMDEFAPQYITAPYKEMHAYTLFKDILSAENNPAMAQIMDKLEHYVDSTVKGQSRRTKPTIYKKGLTADSLSQSIFVTIIVRRLVSVVLFKHDGSNIMRYIRSCAAAAAISADSSGNGIAWEDRKLSDELSDGSDGDDGNSSILEQETSTSSKTADFQVMIEFAIEDLHKRFCVEHDLDIDAVNQAITHYSSAKHLVLDITNSYLLSIMFGGDLCGARSVEMLSSKDLAILIAMMQVYLISIGMRDLVHVVSLITKGEPRSDNKTGAEMDLISNWRNSTVANNCDARFPYSVNGIYWWTSLKKLIDTLVTTKYFYNTAPVIWEMLGEPNRNGQMFTAPANLATMICSCILQATSDSEEIS